MHTIRTLLPWELPKFRDHLLRLTPEDRRLRFGHALSEAGVDAYVRGIDWVRDRVLACDGDGHEVIGAVHVCRIGGGGVELAFSVEGEYRNRGIGAALAERAMLWARNRGYRRIHAYCQPENMPMRRLASRCGMKAPCEVGECEGMLELEPATMATWFRELVSECLGFNALLFVAHNRTVSLPRQRPPSLAT
jgi:RimJ/RimL family protein N-acetyltransferase